jgi:hypothetical protein
MNNVEQAKDIFSILFDKFTSLQKDKNINLSQIHKDSICKEVMEIINNDAKNPINNKENNNKENRNTENEIKENIYKEKINPPQKFLSANLLKQIQKENTPVKVLTSLSINNKSNPTHIHASNTNSTIRQPLKALPSNLMNQITTQKSGLKPVTNNSIISDNKWMKPKESSEKNDMRSILERRIGAMR